MKKTLILMTILLVLGNVAKGMDPHTGGAPPFAMLFHNARTSYRGEGPFVLIPASLGEYSTSTLGFVLVAPFEIGYSVLNNETPDVIRSMKIGYIMFAPYGRVLLGCPFYIVKKVVWDAPVYLWQVITDQVPHFKKFYTYGNGQLDLEIVVIPPSNDQGNIMFIGNKDNPRFSYDSDNCKIQMTGKNITVNGTTYISQDRIFSIRIEKDFSVKINDKTPSSSSPDNGK